MPHYPDRAANPRPFSGDGCPGQVAVTQATSADATYGSLQWSSPGLRRSMYFEKEVRGNLFFTKAIIKSSLLTNKKVSATRRNVIRKGRGPLKGNGLLASEVCVGVPGGVGGPSPHFHQNPTASLTFRT